MKMTNRITKTLLLSASMLLGQQSLAAPINPESQPLGAIGPLELSTTDLTNGATGYRGWFENGAWQGDLVEYTVTSKGEISSSVDLGGPSPAQKTTGGGVNWSAHGVFAATANTSSHWYSNLGRKIITLADGKQVPFRWDTIDPEYQDDLDSAADVDGDGDESVILNFLRGDRSNEAPDGAQLRLRFSVLGDIIHSNPEYVAAPTETYSDTAYATFKNDRLDRAPRVYVGANDGMLHAFSAADANALTPAIPGGQEVWAYVPSMLTPKLSRLAGVPYSHRYFVDGGIAVRDAYSNGAWRTVLVGSLGAGGKGLYALDITDPDLDSETENTGNNKKIIWEEAALNPDGSTANANIGYIFDKSTIAQANDGKWYAFFGNGIASASGVASLMMKEINTSTNPAAVVISTGLGGDNGLAAPALVDTNNDGKVDIAWAGDIKGNMWRFNLDGTTPAVYKVFAGSASQPITLAPDITKHPQFGYLVLFGTGKLYEGADVSNKDIQALYGIWDKGSAPGTVTQLTQVMTEEIDYSDVDSGYDETVRNFKTVGTVNYASKNGWKVELPAGQRLLTAPQLRAGRVKTTITDPDGYSNWFLEVTFDNGSVADGSIFNLNRDTSLDIKDRVDGNGDGDRTDPEDIPMAWKRPDGNMSQVTIANLEAGFDTLFLNFLNPPYIEVETEEPCEGSCEGGITGGHIDVDYDTELGGGTDKHEHEYDKKTGQTYVDQFALKPTPNPPPGGTKAVKFENNIHDSLEDDLEEKFIVLMANADLSKGATLTLNNKDYNGVKYQREIHKALYKWDGEDPDDLKDSEGSKLAFTLQEIIDADGTIRNSFNQLAIIAGGLIPTQTGCVKTQVGEDKNTGVTSDRWVNDRWRNGALTIQLVKASHFKGLDRTIVAGKPKENALDKLYVQLPPDLSQVIYLTDGKPVLLSEDLDKDGQINKKDTDHEIFGGLRAIWDGSNSPDEFLYESTLFWHFGKLYAAKALNLKEAPCYGGALWELAYVIETQGAMSDIFYELLKEEGFTTMEELADAITDLEAKCDSSCTNEEEDKLEYLQELYKAGVLVENYKGSGSGGDGSGDEPTTTGDTYSGDEPLQSLGQGIDPTGKTTGPNFNSGRRTWIDILPE